MSSPVTGMASPSMGHGRALTGSPSLKSPPQLAQLSSLPPLAAPGPGLSPIAPSLTTSPTTTSVQSSPDALHGKSIPSHCPTPLQLPDSAIASPSLLPQQGYQEGSIHVTKKDSNNSGLIRRVSRSAMNAPTRLLRQRPSFNSVSDRDRDQSFGPLVMRRQSSAANSTDHDVAESLQEVQTIQLPENVLGISNLPSAQDNPYRSLALPANSFSKPFGEQDDNYKFVNRTDKVDKSLQKGIKMTKITGKKRKEFTFTLDPSSVKISWHPSDSTKRLYVDDILEIRKQAEAANYRQELGVSEDCESRWFTIVYTDPNRIKGRPTKTMHLVAPDSATFDKWIHNLENIIDSRQRTMQIVTSGRQGSYDAVLPPLWRREMEKLNPSGSVAGRRDTIDFLGVQTVCRSLHMDCNRDWLRVTFNEADVRKAGSLTYEEFRSLFRRLKQRSEIEDIYRNLIEPGADGITILSFFAFLHDLQGVDTASNTDKWARVFFDCIHPFSVSPSPSESPTSLTEEVMNLEAFTLFLSSSTNDTLRTISQPGKLDKPLAHYYISSSHNTYLMGRQVAGMSSTEAYVMALKKGCRCVEIDCWDGDNGQPVVTHGRTMTSQVSFQDCCQVIAKHAFYKSEYPLILSLEVHCNPMQQQIMRNIMEKEFGDSLVKTPINDSKTLPSPEELKNRVLVKVKAHTPDSAPVMATLASIDAPVSRRQRSLSSPQSRPPSMTAIDLPLYSPRTLAPLDLSTATVLPSRPSLCSLSNVSSTEESDAPFGVEGPLHQVSKPPKSKIIKNLGQLGVYTSGFKFRSFVFPEARFFNHIFSLAEGDFENLCSGDNLAKLEKHNFKHLMRVYPGRMRIRSSNFNPLLCWRRGAQMAALNWQTYDIGMQLNDAMFASQADSRGYVLKPKELRDGSTIDGLDETTGIRKVRKQKIGFSLDLISGQQLPRPRNANPEMVSSPYVEIELLCAEDKKPGIASGEGGQDASRNGMAGIGAPHRRRSRIVERNGYNPQFKDNFKLWVETRYPSLVFVRWSVWSSPDGRNASQNTVPLATFTAKLSDLEQGYRYLPLYDHNGEKLLSTLFCRIMKEQPISIDGFGRDDREASDKPGRLRTFTNALRRTLSSKEPKPGALSRRGSMTNGRRHSKERNDDTNELSTTKDRSQERA